MLALMENEENLEKKYLKNKQIISVENEIVSELKDIISNTKFKAAQSVNHILTIMYWDIGNKISKEILKDSRAEYGKSIVVTVSRQ